MGNHDVITSRSQDGCPLFSKGDRWREQVEAWSIERHLPPCALQEHTRDRRSPQWHVSTEGIEDPRRSYRAQDLRSFPPTQRWYRTNCSSKAMEGYSGPMARQVGQVPPWTLEER